MDGSPPLLYTESRVRKEMRLLMNRDRVIQRRMSQSDTILFLPFPFSLSCGPHHFAGAERERDGCAVQCPFLLLPAHFFFFFFFLLFGFFIISFFFPVFLYGVESGFIIPPRKNLLVIVLC